MEFYSNMDNLDQFINNLDKKLINIHDTFNSTESLLKDMMFHYKMKSEAFSEAGKKLEEWKTKYYQTIYQYDNNIRMAQEIQQKTQEFINFQNKYILSKNNRVFVIRGTSENLRNHLTNLQNTALETNQQLNAIKYKLDSLSREALKLKNIYPIERNINILINYNDQQRELYENFKNHIIQLEQRVHEADKDIASRYNEKNTYISTTKDFTSLHKEHQKFIKELKKVNEEPKGFFDRLKEIWDKIVSTVKTIWKKTKRILEIVYSIFVNGDILILKYGMGKIEQINKKINESNLNHDVKKFLTEKLDGLYQKLKKLNKKITNSLQKKFKNTKYAEYAKKGMELNKKMSGFEKWLQELTKPVKSFFDNVGKIGNALKTPLKFFEKENLQLIDDVCKKGWNFVKEYGGKAMNWLGKWGGKCVKWFKELPGPVGDIVTGVCEGVQTFQERVGEVGFWNAAGDALFHGGVWLGIGAVGTAAIGAISAPVTVTVAAVGGVIVGGNWLATTITDGYDKLKYGG